MKPRTQSGEPIARGDAVGPDLLSPLWAQPAEGDPVAVEMAELGFGIGRPDRVLDGEELTPDEYDQLVRRGLAVGAA